ncbi:eukaryotic peptide chain release factor GTP-binding subunit ERF3A-like [Sycon ciliatum]|uniref:eukaryotic peptide chain release factor GTP-binding subunit ERF3A-like n=1 Tax=Sycon ciliatum TaxID=27933 RepID=UPI0031F5F4D3
MSAPDSWESIADDQAEPPALNPNAGAFVPGKNIHASSFVPRIPASTNVEPPQQQPASSAAATTDTQQSTEERPAEEQAPAETSPPADTATDAAAATSNGAAAEAAEACSAPAVQASAAAAAESVASSDVAQEVEAGKAEALAEAAFPSHENVNIVFIGHVDAGKSTIGGQLLKLTGMVDKRTLEKYEREAKEKNRESWYLSWALDTNTEEREKGKTVEVGRAMFNTEKKRFTILDAPGHRSFVPNMINGAAQADIAILVISARRGEFETGFERGGQTREHAMLAKTAGVKHLIILVNKMDDSTVQWKGERYEECKSKLMPYLKQVGFRKTDCYFMPVSGLTGTGLKERVDAKSCPWYTGPAFLEYLDQLPTITRSSSGPIRIPIVDRYKDMGTIIMGKLESGGLTKGQSMVLMPNRANVDALAVFTEDEEVQQARAGENIKLKLKGVEEEDVSPGFVLCSPGNLCHTTRVFDAQVVVMEYKSIICAGYGAVLHVHTAVEDVKITNLIATIDRKTGQKKPRPRFIKQDMSAIVRLETSGVICLETFKEFPQLGRFTLRDEGKTVAVGKVLKLISTGDVPSSGAAN